MYADIYTGYPLELSFLYKIPENFNLKVGCRVKINFRGRITTGFTVAIHNKKSGNFKVKDILEQIDEEPIFNDRFIQLASYTAGRYISTIGETLSLALPSGLKESDRFKNPFDKKDIPDVRLTDEQAKVEEAIIDQYHNGNNYHLIFGITGSGKTEVYIKIAKKIIEEGKSVIYMVPEISLSSQIFERLYNIFGDKLIVYHSRLTANQRLYNWNKFYKGEASIAIGTRSSIFLQCPKLGMIIFDEEQDASYKEHSSPRYSAKNIAFYRAKTEDALLLFGSATPSLETLYSAENGQIKLHHLNSRFSNATLPEIEIVKIEPNAEALTSILKIFTKKAIDAKEQVVYLLNRRGFAPFVMCGECKEVIECPHCSISLNFHRGNFLLCHYCGYKIDMPLECPSCKSEDIFKIGAGTQKVEELVKDTFTGIRIERLDQDSAKKKSLLYSIIKRMTSGEIDLLLGTQMIAKGFDFPNVTLVGILMADIGLNLPDFRAAERIFSLLIQVAGRSGRGEKKGRVVLQALNENHEIYRYIKDHDFFGFYKNELSIRKMLNYPPFSRLARLLIRGKNEKDVSDSINDLNVEIRNCIKVKGYNIDVLGPSAAPFLKISDNFRYHMILKGQKVIELRDVILNSRGVVKLKSVYLEIDMDPYDML